MSEYKNIETKNQIVYEESLNPTPGANKISAGAVDDGGTTKFSIKNEAGDEILLDPSVPPVTGGDVVGPESSLDEDFSLFDGLTGKIIKAVTPTEATSKLVDFVGDSGTGGNKGLVPAPSAGDAEANKVLGANGLWVTPSIPGPVDAPSFSAGNSTNLISVLIPEGDHTQPTTNSGLLIVGRNYVTENFVAGDDFSNVANTGAAANVTGAQWTCIATTPTNWTNLSELIRISDLGYRVQLTMLEANEDQKANSPVAYKDITDTSQSTFLDETGNKFLFPSNLYTFGNSYVQYMLRTIFFVDLSAVSNATTKYYLRLRRESNDTIVAQDEFIHSDFPAIEGEEKTSEIITFVQGEGDPFVVDGCYLDLISGEDSTGTVTLRSASYRAFSL